VGAGLPVISTLDALQNSGDKILKIEAVLSGSLSFIFNNFKKGMKFSDIVKQAQEKGYTEPDPRDDLSGLDVARKALILSREIGIAKELDEIVVENLIPTNARTGTIQHFFDTLKQHDQAFEILSNKAEAEGKVLRYMAIIEGDDVRIALNAVDQNHPFYQLSGSDNMIVFTSERYRTNPLVIKGPGAGAEVTAAGVFAEIISIGSYLKN
jgi:aspartokinase/homoserine dehydrogenase 1